MRSCGVLLPITSLPSKYGIGTLGKEAYRFIDFLEESGQQYWQILPIGPTTIGDSPYQCFSAFAGNPLMIDFDLLIEDGLLEEKEVKEICWAEKEDRVDYALQFQKKYTLLKKAWQRFKEKQETYAKEFSRFEAENQEWLFDYAFFMALKYEFGQKSWEEWDDGIRLREEKSLSVYREKLKQEIQYWQFVQFVFFSQYEKLKAYAKAHKIGVIGDIPIYVSYDSADVWTSPELFDLDENRTPKCVAGCPPDDTFSKTGQLWGNPLYNWEK